MSGATNAGETLRSYDRDGLVIEVEATVSERDVLVHVSEPLTDGGTVTFEGPVSQQGRQNELVRDLFKIRGVNRIILRRYCIELDRAAVFSWDDILPQIEETLVRHYEGKSINAPAIDAVARGR